MTEKEFDSTLGIDSKCDVCGKLIKVGDRVIQIFIGTVMMTYDELGIKEERYGLLHVDCQKVN